jgi:hypothetical protein
MAACRNTHWLDVYVSSIYDLKAFISSHIGATTEERRSTNDFISVSTGIISSLIKLIMHYDVVNPLRLFLAKRTQQLCK